MTSIFKKLETLISNLSEYLQTRIELFKLEAIEKTSSLFATIISGAVLAGFLFIFFVFLSIGLALLLGEVVHSTSGGFFIVAGLYLLLGVVGWTAGRRRLKTSIRNRLVSEFMNRENK